MTLARRPLFLVLALVALLSTGCAWVERASLDSTGGDANETSNDPSISADGRYVAFRSIASDLVPGDNNAFGDVFVRDVQANTTTRVSVDTADGNANGHSYRPAISADGRYVAFISQATDLVPGDGTAGESGADVFVRDLQTGTTTRVSVDTAGGDPNGASGDDFCGRPAISGDGRYVAFCSFASDLVPGDGTGVQGADVFVRDRQTDTTTRVSVDTAGGDASNLSRYPSISSDGRYVAFDSNANDLIPGGNPNPEVDVFVRDLQTSTTTRVSVNTAGGDPNDGSSSPSISADGRYVAFYSFASDLVAGDTDQFEDVFVRDRQTGTTTRASVDTAGGDPNSISNGPSISGDGRYVAFRSPASDLVPGDQNSVADVFVRDRVTNTTIRASVDFLGREAHSGSSGASMAGDGRYVAFYSAASGLVAGDGNGLIDVFVKVVVKPTVNSVAPDTVDRGSTITLTVTGSGFLPGAATSASAFSTEGVTVNSVTVVSENELQVSVTAAVDAPVGTRHVTVWNPGTGPGVHAAGFGICPNCLTVT